MRNAVRARAGDVAAVEENPAGARRKLAGEQVEERGLAGAVRADDRMQRALLDAQAQRVDRGEGAEGLRQLARFEKRHFIFPNRDQASTTPPRKKSTTMTNATPRSSGQPPHLPLIDSESQMNPPEPMIGP